MLSDADRVDRWGHAAQRQVHERFLVFAQLTGWMRLLESVV
jgi:hypothetical protein